MKGKHSPRKNVIVMSDRELDNIKKFLMCPICKDYMQDMVLTRCNHSFCRECIYQALRHKNVCPMCSLPTCWRELTTHSALGAHFDSLLGTFYESNLLSQAPQNI